MPGWLDSSIFTATLTGTKCVLSVRMAGTRPVPYIKKWTRPYIRIEDPCDCKNVTPAVYEFAQFSDIREAFRRAMQKLARDRCRLIEITLKL